MNNQTVKSNNDTGVVLALCLVFVSGFLALIYQVLWMKQLGLLFGNTSHASSATLVSFFAGLATGSWFLGKRVSKVKNPMQTYAKLEVGIAITALLYFVVLLLFQGIYPAIYQSVGNGLLLLLIKFLLSLLLVFPPAFFMGGTIPVMGQYMVRKRDAFARVSALMYGVNTLGAASGAALAGFYLPMWLGYNMTCGLAIALSVGVGFVAFRSSKTALETTWQGFQRTAEPAVKEQKNIQLSRQEKRERARKKIRKNRVREELDSGVGNERMTASEPRSITMLCFFSGFAILALEVLWTRMFSQVLENSVYTFAVILVVVLICLALGALSSSMLSRLRIQPLTMLTFLILMGAGMILMTPHIFMSLTNGMELITSIGSWSAYIWLVFNKVLMTVGPSALILGMIFPYLMKAEEEHFKSPGLSLGRLATINTIGAIVGAFVCGFMMLDGFGMWRSIQIIAIVYLFVALILPLYWDARSIVMKVVCGSVLLATIIFFNPSNFPLKSVDPANEISKEEKIIEIWEGSDCTVAVTESSRGVSIKINSDYSLGNTDAYMLEKLQTDLPLLIFPETESIFYLGLGTGITAGSALDPKHKNVKRVVACELVPEVIIAAEKYIATYRDPRLPPNTDMTGGLFTDKRATVLAEDGRHHLMASNEKFDMINADLFVPFRSGAGSLYSKEHYENAKKRLTRRGVFVQWLPLYQLTKNEFSIVAKTMIGVFDQVSLWRHNFYPGQELVALVGHLKGEGLATSDFDNKKDKFEAVKGRDYYDVFNLRLPLDSQSVMLFYGGNLTESGKLFEDYPINTDNKPVIEYQAPRSYRGKSMDKSPWFTGAAFADFVDQIQKLCPPENDPLLKSRNQENRLLPLAGSAFHRAFIGTVNRDQGGTQKAWSDFIDKWLNRE